MYTLADFGVDGSIFSDVWKDVFSMRPRGLIFADAEAFYEAFEAIKGISRRQYDDSYDDYAADYANYEADYARKNQEVLAQKEAAFFRINCVNFPDQENTGRSQEFFDFIEDQLRGNHPVNRRLK